MMPTIAGMSMESYRAHEGVSATDLKSIQRSPAYAKLREHSTTPAKAWGTAVHCAILEPDELHNRYAMSPESPKGGSPPGWKNTTAYRDRAAELAARGFSLLSRDELTALDVIRDRVSGHKIGQLIHRLDGMNEVSVIENDIERGIIRKCRPDRLIEKASAIIDIKTTIDHRRGPFSRSCAKYGYALSASYYLDTCKMDHFVFLVVASTPPYECAAYTLDSLSIEQGRAEYTEALDQWVRCRETGEWPAGSTEIEEISLPAYAMDRAEVNDVW